MIARQIPAGDNIAFSPPLIITEAEIDEVFDQFGHALDDGLVLGRQQGLFQP